MPTDLSTSAPDARTRRGTVLPLLLLIGYGLLQGAPSTRDLATQWVQENHVVEVATFLTLLLGGLLAFDLARRWRDQRRPTAQTAALRSLGVALVLVAMEEISWGQQFLHFATPGLLVEANAQGETTLHNLRGVQGTAGYLYLLAGTVGLLLTLPARLDDAPDWLRSLTTPSSLVTALVAITLFGFVKLYADGFVASATIRMGVRWTSEVVEMLVGCVGLGYVGVKWTETTRPLANGFRGEVGSVVRLLHRRCGRRGGLLGRGEDAG